MDFDFTTETITPDSTTLLTIGGTGALELPSGTAGQQPGSATAGAIRWNTTAPQVEYYNGSAWLNFGGSVSSVTVSGGTGISTSGSPITTSGTITVTNTGVTSNLAGTGISVSGATGAVTITNTGVTSIAGTAGNITASASTGAVTLNLASVTQSTGSNFVKVTLDGFGRVTGNTAVAQSDLTGLLGTYYLPTAGGTMSGAINMGAQQINNLAMSGTPAGTDAVNVNYVQSQVTGLSWKQAVKASSTAPLTTTYNNGTAGVGATLTNAGTQAAFTVDGVTFTGSGTERVLIKNQANSFENGIYVVTTLGSGSTNWVLTRATDADTAAEVDGAAVYVQQGSTLADTGWTETATMTAIGSGNPIVWAQFSGSGSYTAGTGLTLTGNTFSLTNPVALSLGGTNAALTAVNGGIVYGTASAMAFSAAGTANQVLQSNGAAAPTWTSAPTITGTNFTGIPNGALTNSSITVTGGTGLGVAGSPVSLGGTVTLSNTGVTSNVAGTGISVSGSTGAVTITNTGVTSLAGTAGNITVSGSTGAVTINLATAGTAGTYGVVTTDTFGRVTSGSVVAPIANGGTNSGTALSGSTIMVSNGTAIVQGPAGTTTTVLHGNAGGLPTYGAVVLTTDVSGILPLANGGTNANLTAVNGGIVYSTGSAMAISAAGTSGQYLQSNGAAAPTWVTVTNGGLKFYSEFTTAPVNAPSATASQAIALGTGSSASIYGVLANANGQFATAGDAEQIQAVLRVLTTTTGSGNEMFLDGSGASQRLVLPNNSAWTFTINLVARRTDATGSYGSWIFNGLIYRDANAASTTISGLSKTTIARIGVIAGAANDPVVSADTTNGSLKVAVSGYGTYNIRWVASVQLAQVTN